MHGVRCGAERCGYAARPRRSVRYAYSVNGAVTFNKFDYSARARIGAGTALT